LTTPFNTIRIFYYGVSLKRNLRILLTIIFSSIILILGLISINSLLLNHFPKEKEFLPTWSSLRTFIDYGIEPYSSQATNRTQLLYYKELVAGEKDPLILDQAFSPILVFIPLAFFHDYSMARSIYLIILEIFLLLIPVIFVQLQSWKPPWLILISFSSMVILWPSSIQAIITHDPSIFIIGLVLTGLLCLKLNLDEFAGAVFAFAIFNPSLVGLLFIFIILWVIRNKRWRIIWGFLMVFGLIVILSIALIPDWMVSFIKAFRIEAAYKGYISSQIILSDLIPGIGSKLALLLTFLISGVILYEWFVLRKADFHWFLWTTSLTICVFSMLGLPVLPSSSIILIIPFAYIFSITSQRMKGKNKWIIQLLALIIIFLSAWGFFIYLINNNLTKILNLVIFIIIPTVLFLGLYWVRWWVVKYSKIQVELQ
jgi:hypothetical protein